MYASPGRACPSRARLRVSHSPFTLLSDARLAHPRTLVAVGNRRSFASMIGPPTYPSAADPENSVPRYGWRRLRPRLASGLWIGYPRADADGPRPAPRTSLGNPVT